MSEERFRVLHVDDEYFWRSTVAESLSLFENYHIISVDSGEKALDLLRTCCFDIIISDYQMPEMNGIELLFKIRQSGDMTPFIFFTGLKHDNIAIKAIESGADFFIFKTGEPGIVFPDLNRKILQAVGKFQTIQALVHYKRHESEFFLF